MKRTSSNRRFLLIMDKMHDAADCPKNQYLAPVNRGKVPLCECCIGFDETADLCRHLADSLIDIGTAFCTDDDDIDPYCIHCNGDLDYGCYDGCPGLRARRALGVA